MAPGGRFVLEIATRFGAGGFPRLDDPLAPFGDETLAHVAPADRRAVILTGLPP